MYWRTRKRDTFNCSIKFILQNQAKHPEFQFHRIIGVQINLKNKIVFFFPKGFSFILKKTSLVAISGFHSTSLQQMCCYKNIQENKKSGKVKSKFTKEQNAGYSHPHTSGPSPPGMSYKTTKIYLVNIKAAKARILSHLPLWCYCHWEESGPVWLFFSLQVWLHWDRNI